MTDLKQDMKYAVKLVIAILKGDDDEATGLKIMRLGSSALKTQINQLEGDTMQLEDAIEKAEENAIHALVNFGRPIEDRNEYVNIIINCENELELAKEALEEHNKTIELLKAKLEQLNA